MVLQSEPWSVLPVSLSNASLLGIIFTVCLLLLDFMKRRKTWRRFPPGPPSVPFLGNMLQVDFKNLPRAFKQLSKQYGDVFSLQIFGQNLVVLNGFEVVTGTLLNKSEDVADRPVFPVLKHRGYTGNSQGVALANYGQSWKEQRRFCQSTLRNLGMGKKSIEERVILEAGHLCATFQDEQGRPFDPHIILNKAVGNVICSIMFGDRFEYDDDQLQRLLHMLDAANKEGSGFVPLLLNTFPCVMNIPGLMQKVLQAERNILAFVKEIVSEHKKDRDPEKRRDFIDAFLQEMANSKDDGNTSFTEINLLLITYELFGAGTETTSTTLRWALLFMLCYPGVQRKVQEEIDRVIGRARSPTMNDQLQMAYTSAVIHETQRLGDVLPLALPHMTFREIEIQGFIIPKGTTVITNLSSVLKDETVWEKPHQFYPEHFLDADGKFVKREAFIPFSAGRRVCLGEQLARMELFLLFTSLVQRFTFEIPNDQPRPREDPVFMFSHNPHRFEMCAKVR